MTENGWPLRENYYSEFEMKRISVVNEIILKNSRKSLKTDKLIIGGLLLVRIIILDLILKKEFIENE